MVNKEEISPRKKLAVVRKINRGDLGPSEAARRLGVHVTAVRRWVSLYKRDGAKAFRKPAKPAVYTDEQRKAAVPGTFRQSASSVALSVAGRLPLGEAGCAAD